jgi:plastocyanin
MLQDVIFEYTFENGGTYDYHCKLHPEMVGKIIVTYY